MRLIERIFTKAGIPEGVSWHTPTQANFRDRAQGRWVADVTTGAHAPCHHVRVMDNGCVDVIGLESNGTHWIDLGGRGGVDVSVGRI